jgi:hypothetical protein
MKKHLYLLIILLLALTLTACQSLLSAKDQFLVEYNGDVSVILAAEDDYTKSLSAFDYAAKFKSEVPLSSEALKEAYSEFLEPYTKEEIKKLNKSFSKIKKGIKDYPVILPETLYVFSESTIESGAAYSRGNTICIPKTFMNSISPDQLDRLVAHEFFHVLSRYNKDLRPAMYAIIGYRQVNPLIIPDELKDLTIANPDAPDHYFAITCTYEDKPMDFIPITYSETSYDTIKGGTFFDYFLDEMLAVTITESQTLAVYKDNQPLLVSKFDLDDFTTQIGTNSDYTYHPEETTADHFVMLLLDDLNKLPNPELITALEKVLKQE